MRQLSFLLTLLMVSVSWAQISVRPTYAPYQPIVASIDSVIPDDAEVKIRWSLTSPEDTTSSLKLVGLSGYDAHIWASPGKHKLTAYVTWIQFEEIEVTLTDGTTKKIKNLLKWDSNSHEEYFTVVGPDPDPTPDPDPDPDPNPLPTPGPRWILMIHEVQDTSPQRENLWLAIRGIEDTKGVNDLIQIDDDAKRPDGETPTWLAPYLELLKRRNVTLPAIIIATKASPTKILYTGTAPTSIDNYKKLIADNGGGQRTVSYNSISIPTISEVAQLSVAD